MTIQTSKENILPYLSFWTPYHTRPKIWKGPFDSLLMRLKITGCVAHRVDPIKRLI